MTLTTLTSRAAAAVVAAVAGIISYGHIRSVALDAGESNLAGALLPLGVDGLILVGTMAMLDDKRQGRRPRPSARFALGFGIVATIAGNIGSAEATWTARAVAAVPALSFLIAVEVLARSGRKLVEQAQPEPLVDSATTAPTPADDTPAVPVRPAARRRSTGKRTAAEKVAAARQRYPDATQAEVAKKAGVSVRTAARYWHGPGGESSNGSRPQVPPPDEPDLTLTPAQDDREPVAVGG